MSYGRKVSETLAHANSILPQAHPELSRGLALNCERKSFLQYTAYNVFPTPKSRRSKQIFVFFTPFINYGINTLRHSAVLWCHTTGGTWYGVSSWDCIVNQKTNRAVASAISYGSTLPQQISEATSGLVTSQLWAKLNGGKASGTRHPKRLAFVQLDAATMLHGYATCFSKVTVAPKGLLFAAVAPCTQTFRVVATKGHVPEDYPRKIMAVEHFKYELFRCHKWLQKQRISNVSPWKQTGVFPAVTRRIVRVAHHWHALDGIDSGPAS